MSTSRARSLSAHAVAALFCALAAGACSSSSSETTMTSPTGVKCSVQAQVERSVFAAAGGAGTVTVSANRECEWSVHSDASWVTISTAATGQRPGAIWFTVGANAAASRRSAGITVNDRRVEISQDAQPCTFTVSSNRESMDGAGGTVAISVRASAASCGWTASANVSWIAIVSGGEGTGNGTVTLRVDPVSGPPRSGTVVIAGETVQIDEGTGCSFAISSDSVAVDASGGERQVAVSAPAGCGWTSASRTDWIGISAGSSGSGPGTVVLRMAATTGPARSGTVSVAGRTVSVTQLGGCAVTVSPSSVEAGAQGATTRIGVDTAAGCTWAASTATPWIEISGAASGSGSSTVSLAVAPNTGPARTGTASIAGQTIQVHQANGCTYSVSPTSVDAAANGSTGAVAVATGAGGPWTGSSGETWIVMKARTGTGPRQETFPAAADRSPARTGTVTVADRSVGVTQPSQCTWSFAPPFHDLGAAGGGGNVLVAVTGTCTWTAVSTVDWIQI